jgi:hypothetical protein
MLHVIDREVANGHHLHAIFLRTTGQPRESISKGSPPYDRRFTGTAASSPDTISYRGGVVVATEVAFSEEIPAGHGSFNFRGG